MEEEGVLGGRVDIRGQEGLRHGEVRQNNRNEGDGVVEGPSDVVAGREREFYVVHKRKRDVGPSSRSWTVYRDRVGLFAGRIMGDFSVSTAQPTRRLLLEMAEEVLMERFENSEIPILIEDEAMEMGVWYVVRGQPIPSPGRWKGRRA